MSFDSYQTYYDYNFQPEHLTPVQARERGYKLNDIVWYGQNSYCVIAGWGNRIIILRCMMGGPDPSLPLDRLYTLGDVAWHNPETWPEMVTGTIPDTGVISRLEDEIIVWKDPHRLLCIQPDRDEYGS